MVNVLDDGFAAITGREVNIDVRPGLPVFGEEALEEEAAFDGVDTCYADCVTDQRVGGGAPALAEDALRAGKADEIPDNEEVSGKLKFFDSF